MSSGTKRQFSPFLVPKRQFNGKKKNCADNESFKKIRTNKMTSNFNQCLRTSGPQLGRNAKGQIKFQGGQGYEIFSSFKSDSENENCVVMWQKCSLLLARASPKRPCGLRGDACP